MEEPKSLESKQQEQKKQNSKYLELKSKFALCRSPNPVNMLMVPRLYSYDVEELSKAIQYNAKGSLRNRLNSTEIAVMDSGFPKVQNVKELYELVSSWMTIIDKALFFYLVTPVVDKLLAVDIPNAPWIGRWYGEMKLLQVNLWCPSRYQSLEAHYVSVLAHEMLHAFLGCYSSKRNAKRRTQHLGRNLRFIKREKASLLSLCALYEGVGDMPKIQELLLYHILRDHDFVLVLRYFRISFPHVGGRDLLFD